MGNEIPSLRQSYSFEVHETSRSKISDIAASYSTLALLPTSSNSDDLLTVLQCSKSDVTNITHKHLYKNIGKSNEKCIKKVPHFNSGLVNNFPNCLENNSKVNEVAIGIDNSDIQSKNINLSNNQPLETVKKGSVSFHNNKKVCDDNSDNCINSPSKSVVFNNSTMTLKEVAGRKVLVIKPMGSNHTLNYCKNNKKSSKSTQLHSSNTLPLVCNPVHKIFVDRTNSKQLSLPQSELFSDNVFSQNDISVGLSGGILNKERIEVENDISIIEEKSATNSLTCDVKDIDIIFNEDNDSNSFPKIIDCYSLHQKQSGLYRELGFHFPNKNTSCNLPYSEPVELSIESLNKPSGVSAIREKVSDIQSLSNSKSKATVEQPVNKVSNHYFDSLNLIETVFQNQTNPAHYKVDQPNIVANMNEGCNTPKIAVFDNGSLHHANILSIFGNNEHNQHRVTQSSVVESIKEDCNKGYEISNKYKSQHYSNTLSDLVNYRNNKNISNESVIHHKIDMSKCSNELTSQIISTDQQYIQSSDKLTPLHEKVKVLFLPGERNFEICDIKSEIIETTEPYVRKQSLAELNYSRHIENTYTRRPNLKISYIPSDTKKKTENNSVWFEVCQFKTFNQTIDVKHSKSLEKYCISGDIVNNLKILEHNKILNQYEVHNSSPHINNNSNRTSIIQKGTPKILDSLCDSKTVSDAKFYSTTINVGDSDIKIKDIDVNCENLKNLHILNSKATRVGEYNMLFKKVNNSNNHKGEHSNNHKDKHIQNNMVKDNCVEPIGVFKICSNTDSDIYSSKHSRTLINQITTIPLKSNSASSCEESINIFSNEANTNCINKFKNRFNSQHLNHQHNAEKILETVVDQVLENLNKVDCKNNTDIITNSSQLSSCEKICSVLKKQNISVNNSQDQYRLINRIGGKHNVLPEKLLLQNSDSQIQNLALCKQKSLSVVLERLNLDTYYSSKVIKNGEGSKFVQSFSKFPNEQNIHIDTNCGVTLKKTSNLYTMDSVILQQLHLAQKRKKLEKQKNILAEKMIKLVEERKVVKKLQEQVKIKTKLKEHRVQLKKCSMNKQNVSGSNFVNCANVTHLDFLDKNKVSLNLQVTQSSRCVKRQGHIVKKSKSVSPEPYFKLPSKCFEKFIFKPSTLPIKRKRGHENHCNFEREFELPLKKCVKPSFRNESDAIHSSTPFSKKKSCIAASAVDGPLLQLNFRNFSKNSSKHTSSPATVDALWDILKIKLTEKVHKTENLQIQPQISALKGNLLLQYNKHSRKSRHGQYRHIRKFKSTYNFLARSENPRYRMNLINRIRSLITSSSLHEKYYSRKGSLKSSRHPVHAFSNSEKCVQSNLMESSNKFKGDPKIMADATNLADAINKLSKENNIKLINTHPVSQYDESNKTISTNSNSFVGHIDITKDRGKTKSVPVSSKITGNMNVDQLLHRQIIQNEVSLTRISSSMQFIAQPQSSNLSDEPSLFLESPPKPDQLQHTIRFNKVSKTTSSRANAHFEKNNRVLESNKQSTSDEDCVVTFARCVNLRESTSTFNPLASISSKHSTKYNLASSLKSANGKDHQIDFTKKTFEKETENEFHTNETTNRTGTQNQVS